MKFSKNKTIHFLGIGGIGMSAIARILLEKGYKVTGTDLKENMNTIKLKEFGARIFLGHKESNLREADVIVVSSAIPEDNVEYKFAKSERMKIIKRAEMLGMIMNLYEKKIAVTGTHGKTTTSAMVATILESAEKKPTFLIGANRNDTGTNASLGEDTYFVAESDESDGSFLLIDPTIGIITNMEAEHLEYYRTFDNIKTHFKTFMEKIVNKSGLLIVNKDDQGLVELVSTLDNPDICYFSIDEPSNVQAKNLVFSQEGVKFVLLIDGREEGEVFLQLIGRHNVYNALGAIALGVKEGLSLDAIKKGMFAFLGTKRRMQLIGECNGIRVFDDYGHHPTEIKTTLEGLKASFDNRVICIFQPHRYTRTRDLLETFPDSFAAADQVIITEVYSANEPKIRGVSGKLIVDKMKPFRNGDVRFIAQKSNIANQIIGELRKGDLVITMGAGDLHTVSKEIVARLKSKEL